VKKNGLTLKIFGLLVLNDVGDSIAQLLMKKGLVQTGVASIDFGNIVEFTLKNASSPLLWAGILICLLNFFLWISILYRIELSVAMPVGSTAYIFTPLLAMFFLREHISLIRWAGIIFIILGIHFVSQSTKSEPEAAGS